jgi:hypothetical protein
MPSGLEAVADCVAENMASAKVIRQCPRRRTTNQMNMQITTARRGSYLSVSRIADWPAVRNGGRGTARLLDSIRCRSDRDSGRGRATLAHVVLPPRSWPAKTQKP